MRIDFFKYQGTGNDFVMLDNMDGAYDKLSLEHIRFLCDRKMGVGADGLIKLSKADGFAFEVEYYNADGSQSFCGNGARCSIAFARHRGIIRLESFQFKAIDGAHDGVMKSDGTIELEMLPVSSIERSGDDFVVNTGSPHYIRLVNDPEQLDVVEFGRLIRYSERFKAEGINVNLLQEVRDSVINVQTYERGVEDETLSCGTGVTACALVYMLNHPGQNKVTVQTKGGVLSVAATQHEGAFSAITLSGPAKMVFDGTINV